MPSTPEFLLSRLVAEPSVSSADSEPILELAQGLAGATGDEVLIHRYDEGRKGNLLLTRGPRAAGDLGGLTLCGHLDVVPADEDDWESSPWSLTDRGDRWVGRGACDMKGFVALALDRFARLAGQPLKAPLAVLLTAEEEVGSLGAQRWVADHDRQLFPRQVLIGEPTEMAAVRLHKGHLRLRLDIHGQAAHSGYPQRGRSAIEPAGPALVALTALRQELAQEASAHSAHFSEVPFVTLNVGRISGGVATNVIADRCAVDLGLRPLPGVDSELLTERVRSTLDQVLAPDDWTLSVDNDSPPLLTSPEAPLYTALCQELDQTADVGVSFASDGGTLSRTDVDCVLFGPGSIEVAHRANEFLPKDEFARAGAVLDRLIERFCGARPQ